METPSLAFEEQHVSFKSGTQPALTLHVVAQQSAYEKDFKNWLSTRYAIEGKKAGGFFAAIGKVVNEWSTDSVNIYYKTDKDGDGLRLYFMLEQKGIFLDQGNNAAVMENVKSAIKQQAKTFYTKYYDEHIIDQQKHYESQINDIEKLRKKQDKLNGDIQSHTASVQKTNDNIRDTNTKINEASNKVSAQNSELQLHQRMSDQAKKEADTNAAQVRTKETEYNKMNAAGVLNTREGERTMKDLEKLRSNQEKLQGTLAKANETQTKSENAILKLEQDKGKLESKMNDLRSTLDAHNAEIESLKHSVEDTDTLIKNEQEQADVARRDLDKLKAAKAGLMGI